MKTHILLILILCFIFSCTNASEEDLIEAKPFDGIVTYFKDVKSIVDNNCILCHNDPPENGAPMPLLTYEQVKEAVENRGLISRISSDDLAFLMPFGGPKLPQNLIEAVIQWETDGLLEE